jgi:hypothetical protein
MNKNLSRNLHRDIAYFYVGLIIAFSFSGIALNHRRDFNPQQYTVEAMPIALQEKLEVEKYDDAYFKVLAANFSEADYKSYRVLSDEVRVYLDEETLHLNPTTGEGEREIIRTRPVLGQMTILHKSTNKWWTWFSDIFGVAMLTIAITGMFIARGKYSFRKRGWWLALLGLIFPFIFLFFIN